MQGPHERQGSRCATSGAHGVSGGRRYAFVVANASEDMAVLTENRTIANTSEDLAVPCCTPVSTILPKRGLSEVGCLKTVERNRRTVHLMSQLTTRPRIGGCPRSNSSGAPCAVCRGQHPVGGVVLETPFAVECALFAFHGGQAQEGPEGARGRSSTRRGAGGKGWW